MDVKSQNIHCFCSIQFFTYAKADFLAHKKKMIFSDSKFDEYKIIFSILSQKTIEIKKTDDEFIASFLTLIQKLTYNTKFEDLNDSIKFYPGTLIGGKTAHDCGKYNITRFLCPLLLAAPFVRNPIQINLTGITNDCGLSIDAFKHVHCKLLENFGVTDIELKIIKRGFGPEGQGHIYFSTKNVMNLLPITKDEHNIQKIRGLTVSAHLSSITAHQIINTVKDKLSCLTNDIKFYSDICNKNDSGPSPGYNCVLFAESNKDGKNLYYGESNGDGRKIESVAHDAMVDLCKSIKTGGAYDYKVHKFMFALACLGLSDVSQIEIKVINEDDNEFLSLLEKFFGFRHEVKEIDDKLYFIAFGTGYKNYFKVVQ